MPQEGSVKKQWEINVCINGGEYSADVLVTAARLEKTGPRSIVADGVEIEFDEDIWHIEIISDGE